ncbi:MAG TPA: hypothetical protein VNN80_04620 [Polyangiaceae bacterium]|nr:hypothetical protein [Polyangiaceae bacterium]
MPGVPIPVSIASDMTLPFFPPMGTIHDYVPVPPAPAPPICAAIESPVAVMWGPGFALFQNKLTTTVIHQGLPFALDGHDCGYMITHITLPINNARLPIIILFSGRKMAFAASTVKANGAAVGCSTLLLFPMMCCAFPVTVPTGFPVANSLNTVRVGLTPMDIVFGVIGMAATIVGDILTCSAPSVPDGKEILSKVLLGDSPANWAIKQGLGVAVGVARILITGEGSVQVQAGSSYVGVTLGYSRSADGSYSVSAGGQIGAPVLGSAGVVGGQAGIQYSKSASGESTTTTSHGAAAGGGVGPLASGGVSTNSSTASTTDASGKTTETTTTTDQKVGVVPLHGSSSTSTTTESPGSPPVRSGYRGGHAQGKPWGKPL